MAIQANFQGGPYDTLQCSIEIEEAPPQLIMPEAFEEVFLHGSNGPIKEYVYELNERLEGGVAVYCFLEKSAQNAAACDQTATKH